jgi:hypothetical protein
MRRREEKKKDQLLGALAKKVLSGELSNDQFEKLELAVKYSDDIESFNPEDPSVLALADWLKNGGLDQKWEMKTVICSKCSGNAIRLEGERNNLLTICPKCDKVKTENKNTETEKETLEIFLVPGNEVLSS